MPSRGEQVAPLPVFLVFEVVVLIDLAKVLLVTCVEEVDDLRQLEFGEGGIERSTETSVDTHLFQPLLLLACPLSY